MIEIYLDSYNKYQLSDKDGISKEKTLDKYMMCIVEFIEVMNIKTTEDIKNLTWIDIRQHYINVKKDTLGSQSINLRIAAIRSFLNYLVGKRVINENVAENIKKEKTKAREVDVDIEKIKNMLEIVNDEFIKKPCYLTMRNKMIVNTLLFLGLRQQELRDIKIQDIGFSNGEFDVIGKGNKTRELCLPDNLIMMHEKYLNYRNMVDTKEDYLFLSKNGNKLDKNVVTNIIKNISKKVGLEYVAHDMRHCAVTLLVESGVAIEEVSVIMGHSSIEITQKNYFNPTKGKVKTNINKNILLNNVI